jgi:hypothetical protein
MRSRRLADGYQTAVRWPSEGKYYLFQIGDRKIPDLAKLFNLSTLRKIFSAGRNLSQSVDEGAE